MSNAKSGTAKGLTYKDSGVDILVGDDFAEKIQHHLRLTYGPNVLNNPGGYAGLFALKTNGLLSKDMPRPVLAGTTDGVGTKLKIAFMMDKHDTVGIDLVAMSVNDLVCVGAEPLFFLDYIATGKLSQDVLLQVVKGVADGCRQAECALLGGETAEMPGFYQPGEYDLAGFAVGIVDRSRWLKPARVQPGDKMIGLASSGVHSNGYSLVRKVFFDVAKWRVERHVDEFGCTLGEELLRPTVIYSTMIKNLLRHYRRKRMIRGIAHITGGGFLGNIPRVLPESCGGRIERGSWPVPPVFEMIRKLGKINDDDEMYRVFNMGIGMVLIVSPVVVDYVIRQLGKAGQPSYLIGEVVKGEHEIKIV